MIALFACIFMALLLESPSLCTNTFEVYKAKLRDAIGIPFTYVIDNLNLTDYLYA